MVETVLTGGKEVLCVMVFVETSSRDIFNNFHLADLLRRPKYSMSQLMLMNNSSAENESHILLVLGR